MILLPHRDVTVDWWRKTCSNNDKLRTYLQRLYQTEKSGYKDHMNVLKSGEYPEMTDKERQILDNIAMDELGHAGMLASILGAYGWKAPTEPIPEGGYWPFVMSHVNTYSQYAAANYCGEALAASKFTVMLECEFTPPLIRDFLAFALPEETFHMTTLRKQAEPTDLRYACELHNSYMADMMRRYYRETLT